MSTHSLSTAASLLALACLAACGEPTSAREGIPIRPNLSHAGDAFTFTTIAVPGAVTTGASGIDARGDIVGSYVDPAGVTHGYVLRDGDFTTIDYPGAAFTEAKGLGPNGEIVGTYRRPGEPSVNLHGFLRSRAGEFVAVDYPGHTSIIAQRLLPDGTILGCRHDQDMASTMRGVVVARDEYGEIDIHASMHNGATPDMRRIAGLYTNTALNRVEGYVIDDGVFTSFTIPGSTFTAAWDVNPAGDVVGVYANAAGIHGFLMTGAAYFSIDAPGAVTTRAFGVNARGDVVGTYIAGGRSFGFLARRSR